MNPRTTSQNNDLRQRRICCLYHSNVLLSILLARKRPSIARPVHWSDALGRPAACSASSAPPFKMAGRRRSSGKAIDRAAVGARNARRLQGLVGHSSDGKAARGLQVGMLGHLVLVTGAVRACEACRRMQDRADQCGAPRARFRHRRPDPPVGVSPETALREIRGAFSRTGRDRRARHRFHLGAHGRT
jgi:hypothetical protein